MTIDDAARCACVFPEVTEGVRHGNRSWFVGSKAFAWERPFSKADLRRFGEEPPPEGPILALVVDDLDEKAAALAGNPVAFFTIPHFDGYSAILVRMAVVSEPALRDAIGDAWLAAAPPRLAQKFLGERRAIDRSDPRPAD
jgi:hypothetical protein